MAIENNNHMNKESNIVNIERKLTVSDFNHRLSLLKTDEQKNEFVKSIIYRNYCPVLEKKIVLQTMLNGSVVTGMNGVMFIDQFLNKVNIVNTIIILYTKLDFAKKDDTNRTFFDDYDVLMKNNLINYICEFIGENELNELLEVHSMLMSNFEEEHKTVEAYISRCATEFATVIGTMLGEGSSTLVDFLKEYNDRKDDK